MRVYSKKNVNKLYKKALSDCITHGISIDSRVGKVLDLGPACFELDGCTVNLPLVKGRGLNPFFAIAEASWVLGGLNELDVLQYYLKDYGSFSDDGITLNGAYGYRIKEKFGLNQVDAVINELSMRPNSRRAVISIFAPDDLINSSSKDIPCNISVLFKIRNKSLDMTVINRSNDIYKGVPYNFFVFQSLHFHIATKIGIVLGVQRHISDSVHLYERDFSAVERLLNFANTSEACETNSSLELSIFESIISNIDAINARDFEKIGDEVIRELFVKYKRFRDENNPSVFLQNKIKGPLELLVKDWLQVQHNRIETR